MPGPVERWLETFMCKQYADTFEAYGFQTLQSVCQLQLHQLLSMGVAREHCDNILENVHVLRQTMMGSVQQYPEDMSRNYDNDPNIPQSGMTMRYPVGDNSSRAGMPVNMSVYGPHGSNYGNQSHMMMSQQQPHHQNQQQSAQHQQYNQMYRNPFPGPGYQGARSDMGRQEMGYTNMGPRLQNPGFNQRNPFPVTQVQGSMGPSQSTVQQAHPHLRRNSGQTPQEVANNILHLASSTYPTHHTVQVPLSKNRSAPYQVPPKSPHYVQQQQMPESNYQAHACQPPDYQSSKFVYPNSSPQMLQHSRMSPISPSPGMIQSPHSHHSGQSLPNSSPHGSVHSPAPGGIRSPGSDRSSMRSPIMNTQPMTPQGMSYQQLTPQHQQMKSPVPVNQQLQVSVPVNTNVQRPCGPYGDNVMSPTNLSQLQQHSTHFSPSSNTMSSPGHFSNISSPYTPGSKASHHSPSQSFTATSTTPYLSDVGPAAIAGGQEGSSSGSNPLRSLQQLCMLPERQVVDPKSVVNDACIPSPQDNVCSKNSDSSAGWQDNSLGTKGSASEPAIVVSPHCTDGSNCSPKLESTVATSKESNGDINEFSNDSIDKDCPASQPTDNSHSEHGKSEKAIDETPSQLQTMDQNSATDEKSSKSVAKIANEVPSSTETEEVKCQPKKAMLLRAAQDDAIKQKQESEVVNNEINDKQASEKDCCMASDSCAISVTEKCSEENESSHLQTGTLDVSNSMIDKDVSENSLTQAFEAAADLTASTDNVIDSEYDSDSNLTVRKDTVHTYGKDKLTSTPPKELPARIRGQSTGSYSDELENSDFDYEDHIGCDDIDNNQISDDSNLEKENIMDLDNSIDNGISCSTIPEIKSAIITDNGCKVKLPSSPHWKKSKLNDLQALQHDVNQNSNDTVCQEKIQFSLKNENRNYKVKPRLTSRGKKLKKIVNCRMEINGHESDSDEFCPSNIVDMGIDNGDGTITVSKRATTRKRKQPLKYKDTSFIQGDFIFAEEEEEDFGFEPKKKMKKALNHISGDKNHDVKKSDSNDNRDKNGRIPLKRNGLSKIHQQTKHERSVNKNIVTDSSKDISNKQVSQREKQNSLDVPDVSLEEQTDKADIKKESDADVCVGSETGTQKACDSDSHKKSCDSGRKRRKSKDNNESCLAEIDVSNLAKTGHTGSSSEQSQNLAKSAKGSHSAHKQKSNSENVHQHCNQSAVKTRTDKASAFDTVDGLISVKEENNIPRRKGIVTVISDSDKHLNNIVVVKKEAKTEKIDEVTLDLTCSDDEIVNKTASLECEQDVKCVNGKSKSRHTATSKCDKQNPKMKRSAKTGSNRKKKGKQKTSIYDNDSDYEAGPKCDSLQSLKLNKTHDLMSKKKKREKPDFKGPLIHIKGSKEYPEKCAVVNQPYQEADIKASKTRTIIQNVSSVEISHLPSDKSIFIPNSETEETDTWVCALCGKHSSYMFLGDLFGPYAVDVPMESEKAFSPKHSSGSRGGRSRSVDSASTSGQSSRSNRSGQRSSKEASVWKEVWVHECCAIWADGVFLIGSKIYGLQEACKIASKTVCSRCHEHGAMVGCLHKGCQMKLHHSCAMEEDCILDEENFSLLCPKHKSKKLRQPDPSFSSWG